MVEAGPTSSSSFLSGRGTGGVGGGGVDGGCGGGGVGVGVAIVGMAVGTPWAFVWIAVFHFPLPLLLFAYKLRNCKFTFPLDVGIELDITLGNLDFVPAS